MLIVDDELFNRMALEAMLNSEGIESVQVQDGYKAIELLNQLISEAKPIFRLILLDFSMPVLDGPQTAK